MGRGCEGGGDDNHRFGQPSRRRLGLVPGGQMVLPRALPVASATLHARVGPTHGHIDQGIGRHERRRDACGLFPNRFAI
jgi:hypothetical protein